MSTRDPLSVSDVLSCLRYDTEKTFSVKTFGKTRCFAPLHRGSRLAPHHIAEEEVWSPVPTESPVTRRWHCSEFSQARQVRALAGRFSRRSEPGPTRPRVAFGNPRDGLATSLGLQFSCRSRDAHLIHSGLLSQNRDTVLGTGRLQPS